MIKKKRQTGKIEAEITAIFVGYEFIISIHR